MKIVKTVTIIPVLLSLMLASTGCTDWLDIKPESEIVLEDFWQNEEQATEVMAACYRAMTEEAFTKRMIIWGELRSDNMIAGDIDDENMAKILNVDINPTNPYVSWAPFYRVINYCNIFLHYAPEVVEKDENFTTGKLRNMEAEVLTIRSLAYFYLVRAFKEVPWIDKASIEDNQDYNVAKSSEDEVIAKITDDLLYAEQYAREGYDDPEFSKNRITRNMVRALLADVYLWSEQYEQCIATCDKILADPELELVEAEDMLTNVFYRGNSTETIFELAFDDDEIRNESVRSLYGYYGDITGELSFPVFLAEGSKSIFNYKQGSVVESVNDIRFKDFLNVTNAQSLGYYFINKYVAVERSENENTGLSDYYYASLSPNWIVYRLPEIILMKAEALIQLNSSEEDLRNALDLINRTYLRANPDLENEGLGFETYSDVTLMERLLLRERQRELMFEGKRWFDLMRLARRDGEPDRLLDYVLPKFMGNETIQQSKMSVMNALYFPIAQSELDNNALLEQNPFYKLTGSSEVNF